MPVPVYWNPALLSDCPVNLCVQAFSAFFFAFRIWPVCTTVFWSSSDNQMKTLVLLIWYLCMILSLSVCLSVWVSLQHISLQMNTVTLHLWYHSAVEQSFTLWWFWTRSCDSLPCHNLTVERPPVVSAGTNLTPEPQRVGLLLNHVKHSQVESHFCSISSTAPEHYRRGLWSRFAADWRSSA